MQAQATESTGPEVELRRSLHREGLRFRVHRALLDGRRRKADVVLPGPRCAVFVDGCFWHACPKHGTIPKANRAFWQAKLARNRKRDRETDRLLRAAGWKVFRVWEHEPAERAARRIAEWVAAKRNSDSKVHRRRELA